MPESLSPAPPLGFRRFSKKAKSLMREPARVHAAVSRATEKLRKHRGRLTELREGLPTLLRLGRAWAKMEYRAIPWKSVVSVVAALLYFVSPVDFLPDFIPFIGFIDDAAIVAYVLKSLKSDLDDFEAWETSVASSDYSPAPLREAG